MSVSVYAASVCFYDRSPDFPPQLNLQCYRKNTAPCTMKRGLVTSDGKYAYFTGRRSNSVYRYKLSTNKWEELPSCPYQNSGLVIVKGELCAVGGFDESATNTLLTFRQGKWVEEYPPMKTARSMAAVASTTDGNNVIVIGGLCSGGLTTEVELFQVKCRRWYELTDLPQPLQFPSATVCGDSLHVIGNEDYGYTCSLQNLPPEHDPERTTPALTWNPLPQLPVTKSTAATLSGQLLLIGGNCDNKYGLVTVRYIFQLIDREWVKIHSMSVDRNMSLVASLSPDQIIIICGYQYYSGVPTPKDDGSEPFPVSIDIVTVIKTV